MRKLKESEILRGGTHTLFSSAPDEVLALLDEASALIRSKNIAPVREFFANGKPKNPYYLINMGRTIDTGSATNYLKLVVTNDDLLKVVTAFPFIP